MNQFVFPAGSSECLDVNGIGIIGTSVIVNVITSCLPQFGFMFVNQSGVSEYATALNPPAYYQDQPTYSGSPID